MRRWKHMVVGWILDLWLVVDCGVDNMIQTGRSQTYIADGTWLFTTVLVTDTSC